MIQDKKETMNISAYRHSLFNQLVKPAMVNKYHLQISSLFNEFHPNFVLANISLASFFLYNDVYPVLLSLVTTFPLATISELGEWHFENGIEFDPLPISKHTVSSSPLAMKANAMGWCS